MAISEKRINQSIKTHFYSAVCRERIRGAESAERLNQINVVSLAYAYCHLLLRLCSKLYNHLL